MARLHTRLMVLAALAAFGLASLAQAARFQDPQIGQMEEIFFLSGLETQLDDFGQGMDQALVSQANVIPAAQLTVLRNAIRQSFAGDVMRETMREGLARHFDERGAAGTLAWLRSPLGRRITALEEQGSTTEAMVDLESYARAIAASPPPAERVALIQALQDATGVSETGVDLALAAALGVAMGANASQPADRRASEADITAAIEAQRGPMAAQLDSLMKVSSLYTYQTLTDQELSTYVSFVDSDVGRWYHQAVVKELVGAVQRAAAGVGDVVAQQMESQASGAASNAP